MPRFLHAADIHLDSPLQKLASYDLAPVELIRGASRRALASMVDLAIEQRVDAVLIAGDLYDGNWHDQNTGLHFVQQASRLIDSGITVWVIRGNHDAENVMTTSLPLPTNPDGSSIMLSAAKVETRVLGDAALAVHGRSFATRSVTENLSLDYPPPVPGMANIGMLHTSLAGAEGHDTYSPCTADYLTGKQYDYWALGHVHTRANHAIDDGRVPIVFPGNVQGRHIRECGEKGCMIVDVDSSGRCEPTFHALADVRWERIVIDASTIDHPDEVMDEYRRWLEAELSQTSSLLVTRVEIRGESERSAAVQRAARGTLADLRSAAVAMADGRVWMEDYKVRISPPPAAASGRIAASSSSGSNAADLPSAGHAAGHAAGQTTGHSAPRRSITAAAAELSDAPETPQTLADEFKTLVKKLPPELLGDAAVLRFDQPQWTADLIADATAELEARIDAI